MRREPSHLSGGWHPQGAKERWRWSYRAIVGAGPAGLTAAEVLGKRGFQPIVLEKEAFVGGQLQLADKPPRKEKIDWCFEDLERAARRAGAEIRLNTKANSAMLKELNPYAVIIATGGDAIHPRIPGADQRMSAP